MPRVISVFLMVIALTGCDDDKTMPPPGRALTTAERAQITAIAAELRQMAIPKTPDVIEGLLAAGRYRIGKPQTVAQGKWLLQNIIEKQGRYYLLDERSVEDDLYKIILYSACMELWCKAPSASNWRPGRFMRVNDNREVR